MRRAVLLGALALATSSPLFAGTVYVPLAADQAVGAVRYRTEVRVSNPSGVARRFATTFLPADGGAPRPFSSTSVPARGTTVLSSVAPAGQAGMLEVAGAPQLAVAARLQAFDAAGRLLSSANLPAVGADDLAARNQTVHLQGLAQNAGRSSRFGLITFGGRAARCEVAAFRADGTPLGEAASFRNAAYGPRMVAAPLGGGRLAEARLEVTCNAPFYAYAAVLSGDGGETAFVAPSGTLQSPLKTRAEALRDDPGKNGDGEGGGSNGGNGGSGGNGGGNAGGDPPVTASPGGFTVPGVFLDVRQAAPYRAFELPLRPGVRYKRVSVEFDLQLDRWQSEWFHGITSLKRTDRTLYYGLLLKGSNARTILDLGRERQVKAEGPWKQRTAYHLRIDFDVPSRNVTLRVFQGGGLVHVVNGKMTNTDLRAVGDRKVKIDFSLPRAAHSAYYPPYGSKYSNLKVEIQPF